MKTPKNLLVEYQKLPKVELHLHLEGAIPLPTLLHLIQNSSINGPKTLEELQNYFQYRDFRHFIQLWCWKNQFITKEADFKLIAQEVLKSLAQDNIRYVEAFASPGDFWKQGLSVEGIISQLLEGIHEAEQTCGIKCNLIIDLIRDHGPDRGNLYLDAILKHFAKASKNTPSVIGIGLGGSEAEHPPAPYAHIYEKARGSGLKTVAHAGEAAGPKSIWETITQLKPERIGHGVRAIEDTHLMEYLTETQIPLEVCPISNLRTGIYSTLTAHPLPKLHRAGVFTTINSDDPVMFNTTLSGEYAALTEEQLLSKEELRKIALQGIEASFLAKQEKAKLNSEMELAWEI
jgi:adenosine deaminase